jgi:hypothetical protein
MKKSNYEDTPDYENMIPEIIKYEYLNSDQVFCTEF